MKRRRPVSIGALFVCVLGLMGLSARAEGPQAALVVADKVIDEPFDQTMPVIGRIVPMQSGIVATRIAGIVQTIHAQVGDQVEQGDLLAELVTDRLLLEKDRRAADLARAEAELAIRKNELTRLQNLRKSASFQQSRYDDVKLEVANLENAALAAEAGLKLAEIDLQDAQITAPYRGTVTQRLTEAGAYLSVGSPVVSLVNNADLEAEADVPADRSAGLIAGRPVVIETGKMMIDGNVRAVVSEENPLTRTRTARFSIRPPADYPLIPNQSITVRIPVGQERMVTTVHKDAVINRLGENIVFAIADGKAVMRKVVIGDTVGSRFEVLQGLSAGDTVVIRGNERLRPGDPVTLESQS